VEGVFANVPRSVITRSYQAQYRLSIGERLAVVVVALSYRDGLPGRAQHRRPRGARCEAQAAANHSAMGSVEGAVGEHNLVHHRVPRRRFIASRSVQVSAGVGAGWSVDAAPPACPANPTSAGRRAWSSLPLSRLVAR